jgi:hypothetical protein
LRDQVLHPAPRGGDTPGGRAVLAREGLAAWIKVASADQGIPRLPAAEPRLPIPPPGGVAGAIAALILSLPKEDDHGRG